MKKSVNKEIGCDYLILLNLSLDESDIQLGLISPVTETTKYTTQPFVTTDVAVDAAISHINRPDVVQPNDLVEHLTSKVSC